MKHYRIKASLESPLVVRKERQSQRSAGVQHIAGTLVRGALAQIYLQSHDKADESFRRLFLDEEACRFGPLYPAERVFPLTANSCKREPGFIEDGHHGVVDLLAALLRPRLTGHDWPHERCPAEKCGQELKAHNGFWDLKSDGQPTEPKRRWRPALAAHVGIDRHTHTAAESIFFTLPTLEPERSEEGEPATLCGRLEAEDDVLETLGELLAQEGNVVRVGHARSRGYGRVRITITGEVPAVSADWSSWSADMLSQAAPTKLDPGRFFLFALSMPTGAVLLDQLLRYTLDPAGMVLWLPSLPPPDPAILTLNSPAKAFEGGKLWCVTAVAHHERLRGWNAAHGLPRQDEWAVSRGAVYAYLHEGDASGRATLMEKLRDLQARGVGVRRNEGFGQVVVCDDFHPRFTPKEAT